MTKRKTRRTYARRRRPTATPAMDFINFVVRFWYFFTIIFALIISVTYYVIELRDAHKTIYSLTENMSKMQKEGETLKNQYDNINLSIQQINDKLPGDLKSRLDTLEFKVNGQLTPTGTIQNGAASSK